MLDEATSALDNLTQKTVSDSLDSLKCTRIVIAHRLSTIRQCDRIIVLDQGRIVEDGTYDELLAAGGALRSWWRGRGWTSPRSEPLSRAWPEVVTKWPYWKDDN